MAKSLIRKNQLHPDIGDLVTGYGSSIFVKSGDFNQLSQNLLNIVELNRSITVLTTGNQTISGVKNFTTRPTVSGTGVLLIGEIPALPQTIVQTTGNQTISGLKNFTTRPTINGSGVFLQGENLPYAYILIQNNSNLSAGLKYAVDTSSQSFTVNLPQNPTTGDNISIFDYNETFDINNLIISGAGQKIENVNQNLICDVKGSAFDLIYSNINKGWQIVPQYASVVPIQLIPSVNSGPVGATGPVGIIGPTGATGPVGPSPSVAPLLFLRINGTDELFNSDNAKNYKIPWNEILWFDSDLATVGPPVNPLTTVTYLPGSKNICITKPGLYSIDARFACYDLLDSTDFLRIRLRSYTAEYLGGLTQASNIPDPVAGESNFGIPLIFSSFAQGPIGTTQNGEAMAAGFTTFRVTQSQIPLFLFADFLHVGALWTNPVSPFNQIPQSYPVFDNFYGTRPFLVLSLLSDEII